MLFAIIPGRELGSQLGSMLAGPSILPEAQMLGGGPEKFNCMDCVGNLTGHTGGYTCPAGASPGGIPYCQDTLTWDK